MAFLVSPGVQVQEKDLSNVVPAVATSIGAFAGPFKWGPTGTSITCSSENELLVNYGKPDAAHAQSFLTAASFLKYGNTLKVSRSIGSDASNASTTHATSRTTTKRVLVDGVTDLGTYSGVSYVNGVYFFQGNDTYGTVSHGGGQAEFIWGQDGDFWSLYDYNLDHTVSTASGDSSAVPLTGWTNGLTVHISSQSSLVISETTSSYVSATAHGVIGNIDAFNSLSFTSSNTFFARYPGKLGNSLDVVLVTPATAVTDAYAQTFDYVPTYTANNPSVVTTKAAANASSGINDIVVPTSAFSTVDINVDMYVVGSNKTIANGSANKISSYYTSGSNYYITLTNALTANVTANATSFTFFEADEIHALVIDVDGGISGTAGTVLEKWQNLSLLKDGKRADGTNCYYKEYLNRNSAYVYANALSAEFTNADTFTTDTSYIVLPGITSSLHHVFGTANGGATNSNGSDGTTIGATGDISTALDIFADASTIDVNLLFCGDLTGLTAVSTAEQKVQTIANTRKDTVGFISAPLDIWQRSSNSAKQTSVLAKFNDQSATRDSYSVFDSTPLYVYNKYQDNYVWIPACGHMAGLCANTDTVADAWFSPAGYNRGNLKGVTRLAYNADQAGRDALYQASVNPIVSFPGQGILLYGDKTAQTKPSAFDRINVRRLFIVLEKAIATAAKYQLFEFNDSFTQAMFRNMTEPFLRDIQGRRGITDFLVVCDSTNNTPEVVDNNRFVADIYIKPARSINFITLNFIATRTGVSFSEIAGKSNA